MISNKPASLVEEPSPEVASKEISAGRTSPVPDFSRPANSEEAEFSSPERNDGRDFKFNSLYRFAGPVTLLLVLGLWQVLTALAVYPAYILPSPATVLARFGEVVRSGALWKHAGTTLGEALLGFGIASLVAALLGYPIAHSRLISALLSPLLAATQALPLVALAPLLIIWFGFGLTPKVITCTLIVFFPLLLNTVTGFKHVEKSLLEAAAVFGASRWQALRLVEFPLALPAILTGVKIGLTLSITGAVVGEFISSEAGLGYLLNLGRGQFDTPLVFVALLSLTVIALGLYGLVGLIEKMLLRWQ